MDLMGKYIKMNSQMLDLIKSFESDSKNQKDGYDQFLLYVYLTFDKRIKNINAKATKNKYKEMRTNFSNILLPIKERDCKKFKMKNFNNFLAEMPRAFSRAKRLGLVGDGHGGWHNRRTGEFVAKTEGGQLAFYNKRQKVGRQDPAQTDREKKLSATSYEETDLRDKYISGEIFKVDEWVQSKVTEQVGKIIRRGTNYLIV